jgi:asparagine synthase (glutamine-hydrolysing)
MRFSISAENRSQALRGQESMSVQFGKCNFDGKPVDPKDLDQVRPVLAPYGPDGEGYICKDNLGIVYRAFYTTKESRKETQPYVSASGAIITWDGRLDNRDELIGRLGGDISARAADVEIIAAAYKRWRTNCFGHLIGDWALSIWDPEGRSLIFAKDFAGARHLYYSIEKDQVTWCSVLDPLVLLSGRSFALQEEYVAGWLSSFPTAHLTPYAGIHAVRPCSFVRLSAEVHELSRYWDFNPAKEIRYGSDSEYQEHFRAVFAESVRRRLRSDSPVLAELSGGMDSSSIVCMADEVIAQGRASTPRLDTISYYDDSEPNWNERPYFTKVEERRGRIGCHVDAHTTGFLDFDPAANQFWATPGSIAQSGNIASQFADCITARGNRVVLSGVGGDEVTGGVPTAVSDLADLLTRANIARLAHELKVWALKKRKPWFRLLLEVVHNFLPPRFAHTPAYRRPPFWLDRDFIQRNRAALHGYPKRLKLFGPLPSFQENLNTLDALRRQLACTPKMSRVPYETTYPYLDRDLVEFLFSIPRAQLARPGERRRLMRRALAGTVPAEILNRKRKASVARGPILALAEDFQALTKSDSDLVTAGLGIIDGDALSRTLRGAQTGYELPIVPLMRILHIECWLRQFEQNLSLRVHKIPATTARHTGRWVISAA